MRVAVLAFAGLIGLTMMPVTVSASPAGSVLRGTVATSYLVEVRPWLRPRISQGRQTPQSLWRMGAGPLRFPLAHRRAIRAANVIERLFGEARPRTKVIPHAFGEHAVLRLVYAALIPAAERRRTIRISARAALAKGNPRQDRQRVYCPQCPSSTRNGHQNPNRFIHQ